MARSARRWWATGLDFQMTVNFFLYNILNCLLFTTRRFLSLTPQQETEIFWGLDSGLQKKKLRERGNTRIISIFESVKGNIVWGIEGSIFIWMVDGHLCYTGLERTFLGAGKRSNGLHGCSTCVVSQGLALAFMLRCCCLELFNSFWTRGPTF